MILLRESDIVKKLEIPKMSALDQSLRDFAHSILPPAEWKNLARKTIDRVFEILKRKSKFGIDRCRIVGGFEKGTSTKLKVDVDTVIYYNFSGGSIKKSDVLQEWEELLLLNTDLKPDDIHRSEFLLTFTLDQVPIDLVAAQNRTTSQGQQDIELRQMAADFKLIRRRKDPIAASKDLTLSAQSVEWMNEKKSDFCREIARLAKYWSQTILFDEKVFGKSYIFELIAVKAAMEEEVEASRGRKEPTYVGAFSKFLEKVKNFRREQIIFTDLFPATAIPYEIKAQSPVIINPVNPYQNLLESVSQEFLDTFSKCASATLLRLGGLLGPNRGRGEVESMALVNLFKPQPLLFEFEKKNFTMHNFLVGPAPYDGMLPKEYVNRNRNSDYSRQEHFLKIVLLNLSSFLNLYVWRFPQASATEMQQNAQKVIDDMKGHGQRNWVPSNEKHESRNFSFWVPTQGGSSQRISFELNASS